MCFALTRSSCRDSSVTDYHIAVLSAETLHIWLSCCVPLLQEAGEAGVGEHGPAGTAAHFFRELTVGGVARPVDTLLMASLLLYCSQPFGQVASSSTRQLAFVFRVRCCKCMYCHAPLHLASTFEQVVGLTDLAPERRGAHGMMCTLARVRVSFVMDRCASRH